MTTQRVQEEGRTTDTKFFWLPMPSFVTYLTDEDHFLKEHVETLLHEIRGFDCMNPFPTFIDRSDHVWFRSKDIGKQEDRVWHLSENPQNSISLSGGMHTMGSYRKLDEVWSTTP